MENYDRRKCSDTINLIITQSISISILCNVSNCNEGDMNLQSSWSSYRKKLLHHQLKLKKKPSSSWLATHRRLLSWHKRFVFFICICRCSNVWQQIKWTPGCLLITHPNRKPTIKTKNRLAVTQPAAVSPFVLLRVTISLSHASHSLFQNFIQWSDAEKSAKSPPGTDWIAQQMTRQWNVIRVLFFRPTSADFNAKFKWCQSTEPRRTNQQFPIQSTYSSINKGSFITTFETIAIDHSPNIRLETKSCRILPLKHVMKYDLT